MDRNSVLLAIQNAIKPSLSARRAWIEMVIAAVFSLTTVVALRKESVDRNIKLVVSYNIQREVALRKESVDRNLSRLSLNSNSPCRSPQGERG